MGILDFIVKKSRAVLLLLALVLIGGVACYEAIPKETNPDVEVPFMYVTINYQGISPEDSERLLIKPLEKELTLVKGLKTMKSYSNEGGGYVTMEFHAGFQSKVALQDVREKVDNAKSKLPQDADDPIIHEINFSQQPIVNVLLQGELPERALVNIAKDLKDKIEQIPSVLSVDIKGNREEVVEIIVDPLVMETYDISLSLVNNLITSSNMLVAAGALESNSGKFNIKVPGLLEDVYDIINLPLKVHNSKVIKIKDIATIRKTFKDATSYVRVNGKPAISLEISKRSGENLIETVNKIKAVTYKAQETWPENLNLIFSNDTSKNIKETLNDLENNIIFASLLSLIPVIIAVGVRSGGLVSLSVPASFLMGIIFLKLFGFALNIVVLFSLILSIGMLVDAAIVVCEYADRKLVEGTSVKNAYLIAGKRMAWPVLSSTATTLIVFVPLLFWPGLVGEFMKFMPITILATVGSSLFVVFVFMTVIGSLLPEPKHFDEETRKAILASESDGNLDDLNKFTAIYAKLLRKVLEKPKTFVFSIVIFLCLVFFTYASFGPGFEFFPEIEPENMQVTIKARGNLSARDKDSLVKEVEQRLLQLNDDIRIIYARSGTSGSGSEDSIGLINLELADWKYRNKADKIKQIIREKTKDLYGITIEVSEEEQGPPSGKAIDVQISGANDTIIHNTAKLFVDALKADNDFVDIEDSLPIDAIEWHIKVDREKAAIFGVNIGLVGSFIKMVTNGMMLGKYRPDDNDDEVDVILRFPEENRNLSYLDKLRIISNNGSVPISNFVTREAHRKSGQILRVGGKRVMEVKADVKPGVVADQKIQLMKDWIGNQKFHPSVEIEFKGQEEQQNDSKEFLSNAFILALFAMILILALQFNDLYIVFVIMTAVFLSTVGVILGLLITNQPFGIVMCGVGIIALSGTVVNNNIIFIDTFEQIKDKGVPLKETLIRTGAQRIRPILLTAGTGVLGLMPMVLGMNIDFFAREITIGAPSSQWWRQISTTISGGLAFATILTLFFTPALMVVGDEFAKLNLRSKLIRLFISISSNVKQKLAKYI